MDDAQDVVTLLKRIHQSAIDADAKNHLRDLVFSYRQAPEANTLGLLRDVCGKLGVAIALPAEKMQKVVQTSVPFNTVAAAPLGMRRPDPVFAPVRTEDAARQIPVSSPAANAVRTPERPVVSEVPVPDYSELPIAAGAIPPHETHALPAMEEVAPMPAASAPQYRDPNERINEIKRSVNEHVGNPINLIEADDAIGKEYMQALLDAMKKRNSGMPHEMTAAMERLEKAYAAVDALIMRGGLEHAKEARASQTPAKKEPAAAAPETAVPLKVAVRIEKESDRAPLGREVPPEMKKPDTIVPVAHAHTTAQATDQEAFFRREPKPAYPAPTESSHKEADAPSASPSASGMLSVAKEKQLQDLMRATHMKEAEAAKEKEATRIAAMDPLTTPEVEAGLGQLLSEWSLFKSSGFFGTGPGGKEHVLYRKLAGLPMAAVVAGRFEGAVPKIRQSITDYMNGWRYEDGIIYDPAETFEHYLRKVIRHILDRQKTSA